MNEGLIPKRYAKALYKFACEKGADKGLYRMMDTLGKSFAANPALDAAISNPFIADAKKVDLMGTAADVKKGDAKEASVYADFLKLLERNKRLPLAWAVARAYGDIYRKANRIYRVTVTSAVKLDDKERQRITGMIDAHLNGGTGEFTWQVDPELIGGFSVDIDNERLDASVRNELKQLQLKLLKV